MSDSLRPYGQVVCQAPPSMGFPRQEYLNGLPFPFPWDLPHPGIESVSPALAARSLTLSHQGSSHTGAYFFLIPFFFFTLTSIIF